MIGVEWCDLDDTNIKEVFSRYLKNKVSEQKCLKEVYVAHVDI